MIERLNSLNKPILGLGDVECPQRLKNFRGILGEMDNITAMKYMENHSLLVKERILDLSVDFSTPLVISHLPPLGSSTGMIYGVMVGSKSVRARILAHKPRLLFHGHSEVQSVADFHGSTVVSIGSTLMGYVIEYFGNGKFQFTNIYEMTNL
ncbi:hypothetical protein GWK48_06105 [Metallosphaera tengchongensis]|uniref:Metallophosphoesterase TT1561-like domain-containing protein n=1 Tax=Metallosphaera tengchongensis TaxID=1532350 RepID=A0A6N0NTB8_9CREN|nr:hypothetical protein [Metallosphaera tengchongensis]QKR00006.1 hypothetical protein GWK48_06105 [Metallosphaera tengchongensis]